MSTFLSFLQSQKEQSKAVVDEFLGRKQSEYQDIEPLLSDMLKFLHEYSLLGGKWHRPALVVLANTMGGGEASHSIHQVAASLELLHRYILIHDDIIDRDLLRHGGPTLEKTYEGVAARSFRNQGSNTYAQGMAMVAGDILNTLATQMVIESGLKPETITSTLSAYNKLFVETAAGWQLQTHQNYLPIESVSETDFIRGMELVSARYSFVWPLRIGQILVGHVQPETWNQQLEAYAYHVGIAFQIQDDILGLFGETEKTGKPVGHDYREGKKTLLILKAYERGSKEEKEYLKDTLGKTLEPETIATVQNLIRTTGSLQYSQEKAIFHSHKAQEIAAKLPDSPEKAILLEMAEFMTTRNQ